MVSVEVEFRQPEVRSVKIGDAIAVTTGGCVVLGDPFGDLRVHA